MPATMKCAHDFLRECNIENCKFVHRSNAIEWFRAPHMDRATAEAIIGLKEASGVLRAAKKASKKSAKGKKEVEKKKKVVKPSEEEEEEEEEVESSDLKAVSRPLPLSVSSSSSERKAVLKTPSSQKNPVASGPPASFLLQCHLAAVGIANLALGFSESSEEKLSKILKILGSSSEVD